MSKQIEKIEGLAIQPATRAGVERTDGQGPSMPRKQRIFTHGIFRTQLAGSNSS